MSGLSLKKQPYTYARVSVMKSSLLKKEEYQRLLKVSLEEIISFLESSEYKKEIDELAVTYSGVELMEMALNKNLVNTWQKLKKISSKEVNLLIDAYLGKTDLWNLKTILRGLHTQIGSEKVSGMLMPAGRISSEELSKLIKSGSVEEFIRNMMPFTRLGMDAFEEAIGVFRKENNITEIENVLDKRFYSEMREFVQRIPSKGGVFKKLLEAEIENIDLMTVLRLKKAGVSKSKIVPFVIGRLSGFVKKLLDAEGKERIGAVLSEMNFSEELIGSFISRDTLLDIELELGKSLLKKAGLLLHQHPLSVEVILGYMFAKEIEVKNLKMLLKARQLGLPERFVEKQIII